MIKQADNTNLIVLARYGAISEVARFRWAPEQAPERGQQVVVRCHRGEILGTVLQRVDDVHDPHQESEVEFTIERLASRDDLQNNERLKKQATSEFGEWIERIAKWNLDLQLIDLERTLDSEKQILYVLCERGPDSTKLALQAAATGLGIVEVQPVDAEGLVSLPNEGGGCGSGGCGCSH